MALEKGIIVGGGKEWMPSSSELEKWRVQERVVEREKRETKGGRVWSAGIYMSRRWLCPQSRSITARRPLRQEGPGQPSSRGPGRGRVLAGRKLPDDLAGAGGPGLEGVAKWVDKLEASTWGDLES
jgi:hypothetical protein